MEKRIFVAGASGAVGRRLCPLLRADGWQVFGTSRSAEKAKLLEQLGVEAVVLDVFDQEALNAAVVAARPSVVMHQLTDLPPALDPSLMAEARQRNARIRQEGTRNLVAAALQAGAKRLVAQSIAFAYAPKDLPYCEEDPLAIEGETATQTAIAVHSLETQILGAGLEALVLRYGLLYGPGTGFEAIEQGAPLHVDAAADAARRAATRGASGIYNIAEDTGVVTTERARRELEWSPDFRIA